MFDDDDDNRTSKKGEMECGFFVMMILSCVELSDESKT